MKLKLFVSLPFLKSTIYRFASSTVFLSLKLTTLLQSINMRIYWFKGNRFQS